MANSQDMKAANQTYAGFIGALKIAVPVIAALTLLVILLIS